MKQIIIVILNEVKCNVKGVDKVHTQMLYDKYNIFTANYKFNVNYQLGVWDGKIPYYNKHGQTYTFLLPEIITKLTKLGYKIDIDDRRTGTFYDVKPDIDKHYFGHIISSKSNKPYELTEHQIDAVNKMIDAGSGIVLAGTGFGKAQPLKCKVLTHKGFRKMGDLKVGEVVITPQNKHAKILEIFDQGVTDVYKITMRNGDVTYAHPDHLWKVCVARYYHRPPEYRIIDTMRLQEMCKNKHTEHKPYIPVIQTPIEFKPKVTKFDPYILGSIITFIDIHASAGLYIPFTSSTPHTFEMDIHKITNHLMEHGIASHKTKLGIILTHSFTDEGKELLEYINKIMHGVDGISRKYIYTSPELRQRFLQGACDLGGSFANGKAQVRLIVPNRFIIQDIHDMIHMQGGSVMSNRDKNIKVKSRVVIFKHPDTASFFTDEDKKKLHNKYKKPRVREHMREVKSVEYVGKEETRCILIDDPEHLYITDGVVTTHNTILNAALVDKYAKAGCKTMTIVPATSLVVQTIAQFKDLQLDVSHYNSKNPSIEADHIITTWQTLQNNPNIIKLFQTVVVDECLSDKTNITLADGTTKKISDIEIGQEILSYNVNDKVFEMDVVENVYVNLTKSSNEKMYLLEFDNGISIEVSGNHPIYTKNGMKRADELTEDDDVINY